MYGVGHIKQGARMAVFKVSKEQRRPCYPKPPWYVAKKQYQLSSTPPRGIRKGRGLYEWFWQILNHCLFPAGSSSLSSPPPRGCEHSQVPLALPGWLVYFDHVQKPYRGLTDDFVWLGETMHEASAKQRSCDSNNNNKKRHRQINISLSTCWFLFPFIICGDVVFLTFTDRNREKGGTFEYCISNQHDLYFPATFWTFSATSISSQERKLNCICSYKPNFYKNCINFTVSEREIISSHLRL